MRHKNNCMLFWENHGISSLSSEVAEELFGYELSDKEIRSQALSPDMSKLKKASVAVDNSLSPAHTLLQIHCPDHKGLLYDIMRTLKDCNIQIAYGRFSPNSMGYRDLDLFIQQKDGKKIVDPEKQSAQIMWQIGNHSSYIANALPLHMLAWAEIGRYSTSESDHEWEVYRFLLDEDCRFQLSKMIARN
ncbi:ACT domain-containing protein ACR9-like [Castanea sativa]|uniref:ACT domain-containing protein ACR9-like n=1 Tax=Castanea sativa TaxID=21020 RepID=UPI003F652599